MVTRCLSVALFLVLLVVAGAAGAAVGLLAITILPV